MAILSEFVDEEPQDVDTLLNSLSIPSEFTQHEILEDKDTIARLGEWKVNAFNALKDLRGLLDNKRHEIRTSELIYTCAAFQGDGDWISEDMRALSYGKPMEEPSLFLEEIFVKYIKPIFQANPHPMLNLETSRKLPRAAGGYAATQDAYEGQVWKTHPGIGNVLLWCVQRIDTDAYERLWYLVVPPVMTLLDDFEARYKLLGIQVVNAMFEHAPFPLLVRTGISELILASLNRALTFLHSPHTPDILRAAIPAVTDLIERTTQPGSEQRFTQLCALLGDGVIGSVWMYSSEDPDAVEASVDALPILVRALGIGATRYLKALIPQLMHPLHPVPYKKPRITLQLSSLRALETVIQECSPRIENWKGTIVEGVAKCWVVLLEGERTDEKSEELRLALRAVCARLWEIAPSVRKEYIRLLELDATIFEDLIGAILVQRR
ncbi:hypothetical protein BGY98DRAFT_1090357 [Russula aff. rugulosa BPL654]|nr:hypothetical protein BGY98DRAFT_1090357 [Russula aff. rugulosa BPL654]